MASEDKRPRRMTAAQALEDLQPILTPEEGERWLEESRHGLGKLLAQDDFWETRFD